MINYGKTERAFTHAILFGLCFFICSGNQNLMAQSSSVLPVIERDNYTVERILTTENGLPANGINEIIQDSKGYIWAATYNGLVRYDGNRPVVYDRSNIPGLRTNRFLEVYEDSRGRIWAGLESSTMVLIDDSSFEVFVVDEDIIEPNSHLKQIVVDETGKIWIATNRGLINLDDGIFSKNPELPSQAAHFIKKDGEDIYVVFDEFVYKMNADGTINSKVIELVNDTIIYEGQQISEFESIVRLMRMIVEEDHLLLAHEAGVIKLMDNDYEVLLRREDVGHSVLFGIKQIDDYYLITGSDGFLKVNDIYDTESGIEQFTDLRSGEVIKDHEGSYWLATSAHGIRQFVGTPVYQGNTYGILSETATLATMLSEDGSLWIGTNCEGLYRFSGEFYENYRNNQGISNECVWSIMEQQDGTIWAGTWGGNGVYYSEPDSEMFVPFESEAMEDVVAVLAVNEDSSGNIWFASFDHGVFKFDGENTVPVTLENGRSVMAVRMFFEDQDGTMYITSDESIYTIQDDVIREPDFTEGMEFYNSRVIQKDPDGRIWFGSYGDGILVLSANGEVMRITDQHGLVDNTISQIAFDNDDNVWLGGNSGLAFIAKEELERFFYGSKNLLRISTLGVSEGLRIRETTGGFMPSSQINAQGELFIPTVQGLAKVETERMQLNRSEPNVILEYVEVDGERFANDEINSLPRDAQRIYFNFTALSFKNPERVVFEYILEGFDSDWQSIRNTRQVTYTTLPPGNYTFRIRAFNEDGFGSEEGVSLSFSIPPPFWQNAWFFLLMGIIIVASGAGIYRYRMRKIHRNNVMLQKKVDERTKELQKLIDEKNRLHSILAHDLRNPFASIIGYIDLLRNDFEEKGAEEERQVMERLLDSGRNTLDLLENLLEWSGSDKRGLEVDKEPIQLDELINQAIMMTEAQASFKQVDVIYQPEDNFTVYADRNMMLVVMRNLISNAIKFSGSQTEVVVKASDNKDEITVSVSDQGVGIPKENLPDIFNPTIKKHKVGTQGEQGIGLGLVLCKEFVEKNDGEIWAESTLGEGSIFSFKLNKHFNT